jgi:hypothetical protein
LGELLLIAHDTPKYRLPRDTLPVTPKERFSKLMQFQVVALVDGIVSNGGVCLVDITLVPP